MDMKMIKNLLHTGRRIIRMLLSSLLGGLIVIIVLAVLELNSRPDLSVWHKTVLDEEFRAGTEINSFSEYLELEDRLFDQLDRRILQKIDKQDERAINRYFTGSLSDPGRWPTNWNRSFVLPAEAPDIGVLLIHGLSDSPYSLRQAGQFLHEQGAYVIGLRVPGHGQAPSGLVDTEWEDMAAAVRLAMVELQQKSKGQPLYIVGYSNGGALAMHYTLESLHDEGLKIVDGLVLLSPEIGVTKLAALAKWQERLGHLLGLEKLAWNSILPEYDPWKYGSFALNAGKQAYQITREIQRQITAQAKAGNLGRMPPVLAFQSVVDSTVTAPALVHNLFERLPALSTSKRGTQNVHHELVLFDINRWAEIEPIMKQNPSAWIDPMLKDGNPRFMLTLLSNKNLQNKRLYAFSRLPESTSIESCETGLAWPEDVYSLSHVALPIPPDDPTYGSDDSVSNSGVRLGDMVLRGEKGVLKVPAADMLRLRYNPFYRYLEHRMAVFMGIEQESDHGCQLLGFDSASKPVS